MRARRSPGSQFTSSSTSRPFLRRSPSRSVCVLEDGVLKNAPRGPDRSI
jgi:hypothetical protein